MQRDRAGADGAGRRRARRGRAGRRCARRTGPRAGRRCRLSIGDDVGEHVVGDGQQQQVAGARDGGRLGDAARRAAASAMRWREASDSPAAATTSWPASRRRGGQDGADATRADHAHPQGVLRHVSNLSFQSRRPPCPTAPACRRPGPVWVPDVVLTVLWSLRRAPGRGNGHGGGVAHSAAPATRQRRSAPDSDASAKMPAMEPSAAPVRNVAVLLAGGVGTRVGLDIPKQLIKIAGKTDHRAHADHVRAPPDGRRDHRDDGAGPPRRRARDRPRRRLHQGHASPRGRRDPQRDHAARARRPRRATRANVLFHDAVRPLVSAADHRATASTRWRRYDAVDVAIPSADTIIEVDDATTPSAPSRRAPACAAARPRRRSGSR